MKLKGLVFGFIVILVVWIATPSFLIFLNKSLKLPVFSYFAFKLIGLFLLFVGFSMLLYLIKLHTETGRTTPLAVIESPKSVIAEGPYKYSRNPMYLAVITTFLGIFLLFGHLLLFFYFLFSFPALHLFVILVEEPELRQKFGQEYVQYTEKIPRWFLKRKN
jgi:protein-S-isoprenylcysteine O-methyltransferase Ste14